MSEKKNMIIKVKYPTAGKAPEMGETGSKVITEWNFKRIGMVAAGLLLTALLFFYSTGEDNRDSAKKMPDQPLVNQQNQQPKPEVSNTANTKVESVEPKHVNNTAVGSSQNIVRAQLATGINKNEPVGKVALPLKIGRKETLSVYYFAELKGMKGKTIYHEWLLNDNLVSRKKVNISADPWRTSSKQIISYTMNNDWKVRLADEAGNHLSETAFNLELK